MQAAVNTVAADTIGAASTTLPEAANTSQSGEGATTAAIVQPTDTSTSGASKEDQPVVVLDPQKAAKQDADPATADKADPSSVEKETTKADEASRGGGASGGQIPRGGDEALQDALEAEAQRKAQAAADAAAQAQGQHDQDCPAWASREEDLRSLYLNHSNRMHGQGDACLVLHWAGQQVAYA